MRNIAVWFEIPVKDMERARLFYSNMLGYDLPVQDLGGVLMAFFPMEGHGNSGALVQGEAVEGGLGRITHQPSVRGRMNVVAEGKGSAEQHRPLPLPIGAHFRPESSHRHLVAGEGTGLVAADVGHRAEGLHGRDPPRQDAVAREQLLRQGAHLGQHPPVHPFQPPFRDFLHPVIGHKLRP